MGDRALAGRAGRVVATAAEDDVAADRVGMGVDRAGRCGCLAVGMDPDAAEIGPEAALHVGLQATLEGLPAATPDNVLDRGPIGGLLLLTKELDDAAVAGAALEMEQGVGSQVAGFAGGQGAPHLARHVP